jgi:hypothetical protein
MEVQAARMDSLTRTVAVFAIAGALSLAGSRICARQPQQRVAMVVLTIGLQAVGWLSWVSAAFIGIVAWRGMAKPS